MKATIYKGFTYVHCLFVVAGIGASSLGKGCDSGPPYLHKGDPNRNPWLAKMGQGLRSVNSFLFFDKPEKEIFFCFMITSVPFSLIFSVIKWSSVKIYV
jgi:hypothetical protein